MEQKINIAELLKDAPKGTELYSPIFGKVQFAGVNELGIITVEAFDNNPPNEGNSWEEKFNYLGRYWTAHSINVSTECVLFPSKDCRTWENFKAPWLHKHFEPFQKVLILYKANWSIKNLKWRVALYSHYDEEAKAHCVCSDRMILHDEDILPYEGNEDKLGKEVE